MDWTWYSAITNLYKFFMLTTLQKTVYSTHVSCHMLWRKVQTTLYLIQCVNKSVSCFMSNTFGRKSTFYSVLNPVQYLYCIHVLCRLHSEGKYRLLLTWYTVIYNPEECIVHSVLDVSCWLYSGGKYSLLCTWYRVIMNLHICFMSATLGRKVESTLLTKHSTVLAEILKNKTGILSSRH